MAGMRYQPYGLTRLDGKWRNAFSAVFSANREATTGARLWPLESFTTMGAAAQVDLANNQVSPIGVPVTPSWTLLMVLARHTSENTYPYILGLSGAANTIAFAKAHPNIGDRAGWYDGVNLLDSGFNIYLGEIATISLSYDGTTNRYTWTKNGQLYNSTIGANTGGGVWQFAAPPNDGTITHIPLLAFGNTATADAMAMELTAQPWQIFEAFEDDWGDNSTPAPVGYTLSATPGSFGLAGSSMSMRVTRKLVGGNGSFSLTAGAASLRAGRQILGATGVITLNVGTARAVASRKLATAPGAFVHAGAAASLRASRRVSATTGAFALASQSVQLTVARRLAAASGSFTFAGGAAQLAYTPAVQGNVIVTQTGQFMLTGSAVAMRVTRRIQAGPGSFAHAGSAATIRIVTADGKIDITKISPARVVVFEGSGSRVVPFESSGSRVVPFEGSGGRTVRFE